MSTGDAAGGGSVPPFTSAMGAAYAAAVHRVPLTADEAQWFTSEMLRTAKAMAQASRDVAMFDLRMSTFDEFLRGGKAGE